MSKTTIKYVKEKAFWGDLYIVKVYEEHKNTPGFAPETYNTHICDIWLKYSDWDRRIQFKESKVEHKSTLKKITEIFTGELDETKFSAQSQSTKQEK